MIESRSPLAISSAPLAGVKPHLRFAASSQRCLFRHGDLIRAFRWTAPCTLGSDTARCAARMSPCLRARWLHRRSERAGPSLCGVRSGVRRPRGVRRVHVSDARTMPGVLHVLTGRDLVNDGLGAFPPVAVFPGRDGSRCCGRDAAARGRPHSLCGRRRRHRRGGDAGTGARCVRAREDRSRELAPAPDVSARPPAALFAITRKAR